MATTLSANYGIYGPAFELMEHVPREPGSEEYRNSEKYQIRQWDLQRADSLAPVLKRLNQIRREHRCLQHNRTLRWLDIDNDRMLAYAKALPGETDIIIVVVNLDWYNVHSGWLRLPLYDLGLDPQHPYRLDDLLGGDSYHWQGETNFVRLDPNGIVAHVFRVRGPRLIEQQLDKFA
jgi:starch synthase (maltosyl-transferring)